MQGRVDSPKITAFVHLTKGGFRGGTTIFPTSNELLEMGVLQANVAAACENPTPSETGSISCETAASPAAVDPAGSSEQVGPIVLLCSIQPPSSGLSTATTLSFDLNVKTNVDFAFTTSKGASGPPSPSALGLSTPTATGRLIRARTFAAGAQPVGRRSPGPGRVGRKPAQGQVNRR